MNKARMQYIISSHRLGYMTTHTAYKAVCAEHYKESPNHLPHSTDESSHAFPVTCHTNYPSTEGEHHAGQQTLAF